MRGAANAPTFQMFDGDGDGRVTAHEFAAAHATLRAQRGGLGLAVPGTPRLTLVLAWGLAWAGG